MTSIRGLTGGGAPLGTAAALAVAAGGALAMLLPVHGALAGGLWYLGAWLLLAVAAVTCAELAVVRAKRTSNDSRTLLRLNITGLLALALMAELALITARFAQNHTYGMAWASGGLLLALLVGATWRTAAVSVAYSRYTPSDSFVACAAFVLAEACGGWLTVRFAVEGPLWAAWGLGCAMVVLAWAFWLFDMPSSVSEEAVFGSAAALGLAGVVARSVVRGETAVYWVGGIVAVILLLYGLLQFLDSSPSWPRSGGGRGRAAPMGAQLVGLLVPLASLTYPVWDAGYWGRQGSTYPALLDLSYLAGAGAVLLVAQGTILAWLGTTPSQNRTNELAHEVRRLVEHYELEPPPREEYPQPPPHPHAPSYERRGRDWESGHPRWEMYYERQLQLQRHLASLRDEMSNEGGLRSVLHHIKRPLLSSAVNRIHRRTALHTGLAIDEIWPRIELVAPASVKRQVQRREWGVLASRIVIASAVCTAGVWLFIALAGLGGFRFESGSPALIILGPLLVAAVAGARLRRLLVEAYAAKADAVDVFRFDLAKTIQLALPEDASGMIQLASVLSGASPLYQAVGRRPVRLLSESSGFPTGVQFDELAAAVADRVHRDVREDVRTAVRDEYASLAQQERAGATLAEPDLAQLARDIAQSAARPVSAHLGEHLTELQENLRRDVRAAVRMSLEESVTGPPLTNFVGYLAIELDRRAQSEEQPSARAEGGTIKALAGRRVNLVVSVVRDLRAQGAASVVESGPGKDFFVFEPVRIEDGRDAPTASFDAMADSSTLTSLPQRRNLLVTDESQTTFGFQMPGEEGCHEVWFQLYQAGHLVQVTALKIEVETAPPAAEPGEATGDTTGDTTGGV